MKAKILATLLALLTLAGCGGGEGEYVGIYRSGSSDYDAYVELRDDGTAYYSQRSLSLDP